MVNQDFLNELAEQLEMFISYAVPENEVQQAIAFSKKFADDRNMIRLLLEHYKSLPDAREESVSQVSRLIQRRGVGLFVVSTAKIHYLYAVSNEEILFLGEYLTDDNNEIFATLGVQGKKELKKICVPPEKLVAYWGETQKDIPLCPACGASEGENHLLGCVVEVCPWCDGHLASCNCRFEQLDTDSIDEEEQLEELMDLLDEKGRIPFHRDQAPAYPGTAKGLDRK